VRLLALDTATEVCSAALFLDGVVAAREAWAPREHGGLILPMIEELLREQRLDGTALDAVAFGRGPGAFTGVRLAVAVAQGLGYAWGKPLIPISDLEALAARALQAGPASRVLVCQDARMQEVYWACFERRAGTGSGAADALTHRSEEAVSAPERVALPQDWEQGQLAFVGAGSGFEAYAALRQRFAAQLQTVQPELRPHAREIAALAAQRGLAAAVPAAQAQPVYLRDRVTSLSSN
jgi:tRNA threonylcarbamoyladenosine biosynthesis protein TsaB